MVSYVDTASLRHDVDTLDKPGREAEKMGQGGLVCMSGGAVEGVRGLPL